MKVLRSIAVCGLLLGLLPALLGAAPAKPPAKAPAKPAGKPHGKEDLPPGTVESGVISVEQLSKLQTLQFLIRGPKDNSSKAIVVRTILPEGWTEQESGTKKGTQELDPDVGLFTMLAKPPTTDKETDFVYELRVYTHNLTDFDLKDSQGKPIAIPEKDRNEKGMFMLYLNSMISEMLHRKYKSNTKQAEIQLVPYGVIPDDKTGKMMMMGSRPAPMYFVPISFTHPDTGETVYTFTGSIGEKIISLRFLVAKDQEEFYSSTITMIVNNTWGLTFDQDSQWAKDRADQIAKSKAQTKQNSGKAKP
jgi:hypothetical protein